MDHIGIALHKKESQPCNLRAEGELIEQRVRTTPARFADALGESPRAREMRPGTRPTGPAGRRGDGCGRWWARSRAGQAAGTAP
jgi:hypothetical protein